MSTTHPTDLVEAYIADVKARLGGIPDEERAELLEDVAAHVREVADEHGADQLVARLGTPEQFGDELRTSAGFKAAHDPSTGERWWAALKLPPIPTEHIKPVWDRLEPAWWVLRGVLVAHVVLWAASVRQELIPRIGSSRLLGLVVLVFAGGVSYVLGDRRPSDEPRRRRQIRILVELALVFFGITVLQHAAQPRYVYLDNGANAYQPDSCLRDSAGRAISNLYGFDLNGQLIQKFFLTDQAGRPIDNLCPDQVEAPGGGQVQTQYSRDANGAPVYNVFPRAQQRITTNEMTGVQEPAGPIVPPAVVFPHVDPNATTASTVPGDGTPVG